MLLRSRTKVPSPTLVRLHRGTIIRVPGHSTIVRSMRASRSGSPAKIVQRFAPICLSPLAGAGCQCCSQPLFGSTCYVSSQNVYVCDECRHWHASRGDEAKFLLYIKYILSTEESFDMQQLYIVDRRSVFQVQVDSDKLNLPPSGPISCVRYPRRSRISG